MMKTEQQAFYQPRKKIPSEFPYLQLAFLPLLVYNTLTSHKKQMVRKKVKKKIVYSSCPLSNKMQKFTQKLIESKVFAKQERDRSPTWPPLFSITLRLILRAVPLVQVTKIFQVTRVEQFSFEYMLKMVSEQQSQRQQFPMQRILAGERAISLKRGSSKDECNITQP